MPLDAAGAGCPPGHGERVSETARALSLGVWSDRRVLRSPCGGAGCGLWVLDYWNCAVLWAHPLAGARFDDSWRYRVWAAATADDPATNRLAVEVLAAEAGDAEPLGAGVIRPHGKPAPMLFPAPALAASGLSAAAVHQARQLARPFEQALARARLDLLVRPLTDRAPGLSFDFLDADTSEAGGAWHGHPFVFWRDQSWATLRVGGEDPRVTPLWQSSAAADPPQGGPRGLDQFFDLLAGLAAALRPVPSSPARPAPALLVAPSTAGSGRIGSQ